LAAGTVAIAAIDPSDTGVPVCLSRSVFGIDCPLCGGLRCVDALARGDLLGAADHNVVRAGVLPRAPHAVGRWRFGARTGRRRPRLRIPVAAWIGLGGLLLAFTIARNVDGAGWTDWLAASRSG
jgi:hypothetical protein